MRQFQSPAAFLKWLAVGSAEDFQKLSRDLIALAARIAAHKNARLDRLRFVHHGHGAWRGGGAGGFEIVAIRTQLAEAFLFGSQEVLFRIGRLNPPQSQWRLEGRVKHGQFRLVRGGLRKELRINFGQTRLVGDGGFLHGFY